MLLHGYYDEVGIVISSVWTCETFSDHPDQAGAKTTDVERLWTSMLSPLSRCGSRSSHQGSGSNSSDRVPHCPRHRSAIQRETVRKVASFNRYSLRLGNNAAATSGSHARLRPWSAQSCSNRRDHSKEWPGVSGVVQPHFLVEGHGASGAAGPGGDRMSGCTSPPWRGRAPGRRG